MATIEMKGLSKRYGEVMGVCQVDGTIEAGVTGLLGPNGAGKTTLLRLITGQVKPNTGSIRVDGEGVWDNPTVYNKIGYCSDVEMFYERMTGRSFLIYMARLFGFSKREAKTIADRELERMGIADAAHKKIGAYSKGMRQRLKFAQAMLHDPDVIILDEPLQGMDPVGRKDTVDLIMEFGRMGKTVIVSSHILHEVEVMTTRIFLMNHGFLLAEGDVHEIRELIDEQPRHIQILSEDRQELSNHLVQLEEVQSLSFGENAAELIVQTRKPDVFYQFLNELIIDKNIPVHQIVALDDNLQSVFEYLVK